jgi:hypothetical protein
MRAFSDWGRPVFDWIMPVARHFAVHENIQLKKRRKLPHFSSILREIGVRMRYNEKNIPVMLASAMSK